MIHAHLARRFVQAANKLERLAPWRTLQADQPIAFLLPDDPDPVYVAVLGEGGEMRGLAIHYGERSFDQMVSIYTEPDETPGNSLLLTFEPPGRVDDAVLMLARAAGSLDRIVPVLFAIHGARKGDAPDKHQVRLATQTIEAFVLAWERELLRPNTVEPGATRMLTITVSGARSKVDDVRAHFADVELPESLADDGEDAIDDDFGDVDAVGPEDLSEALELMHTVIEELPRTDAHWIVAVAGSPPLVPGGVSAVQMLMIVDADTREGREVHALPVDGRDQVTRAAAQLALALQSPLQAAPSLPTTITFVGDVLDDRVTGVFAEHGVQVHQRDDHPLVDEVCNAVLAAARDAIGYRGPTDADEDAPPNADTDLMARIDAAIDRTDAYASTPLCRFFGAPNVLAELEDLGYEGIELAYREWYAVFYRQHESDRTIAEQLLQEDLDDDERILLQARIDARSGIYRIAEQRAEMVVLTDVLSDFEVEIEQAELADPSLLGVLLPCRIVRVDAEDISLPLGPMIPQADADRAMQWLRDHIGRPVTSANLQEHPEWLGRLWLRQVEQDAVDDHGAP